MSKGNIRTFVQIHLNSNRQKQTLHLHRFLEVKTKTKRFSLNQLGNKSNVTGDAGTDRVLVNGSCNIDSLGKQPILMFNGIVRKHRHKERKESKSSIECTRV